MAERSIFYYITDRKQFPGDDPSRRRLLLDKVAEAARAGVDFIQLREKDLSVRELEILARDAVSVVQQSSQRNPGTRLLVNSRADVALAVHAGGVHLRSDDISVEDARTIASSVLARRSTPETANWLIIVSCHTDEDVRRAAAAHADLAVFAPIFEKQNASGVRPAGLKALEIACRNHIPVLALGGITIDNAASCLAAGAAGLAGIRLFQENNVAEVIRRINPR